MGSICISAWMSRSNVAGAPAAVRCLTRPRFVRRRAAHTDPGDVLITARQAAARGGSLEVERGSVLELA
jgi:hypothetical protein